MKAMCSRKWAVPEVLSVSAREPASIQTPTVAVDEEGEDLKEREESETGDTGEGDVAEELSALRARLARYKKFFGGVVGYWDGEVAQMERRARRAGGRQSVEEDVVDGGSIAGTATKEQLANGDDDDGPAPNRDSGSEPC